MAHRILVIDRDPEPFRNYLQGQLGYEAETATSTAEAVEKEMAGSFDLFLVATSLAEGSGTEALRRLKQMRSDAQAIVMINEESLSEHDRDYLRFSVPEEKVIEDPENNLAAITRLIIGSLGPPVA